MSKLPENCNRQQGGRLPTMRCFQDNKTCTCDLDDVAKGDCPRDPFRDMPDNDEDQDALKYLNGMANEEIHAD